MKILLADDEEDIRRLAIMTLKRAGDQVLEAVDGEECLTLAQRVQPDVMLLDVMMPKLDGFQVCQRLKASAATKDIPIIFLTASVQEWEKQRGLDLGAIGYLYKPFNPTQLRQQVVALLTQVGRVPSSSG
ncbi:MAG: response regulator [Anaerolineae bacterium]|nr:response regulator [Anaerolineae bacterium]